MSDEEMEFSDDDYDDYYGVEYDGDVDHVDPEKSDPEYFDCACLTDTEVERLLNESVEQLSNSIQVSGDVFCQSLLTVWALMTGELDMFLTLW